MTTNETSFIQRLSTLKQAVKLSGTQKSEMRSTLSSYADLHTVLSASAAGSVASPFVSFFFSRGFVSAVLIILLIGGSGVGVTYAAGNSLPGQPLYGVKVNIAEPIQGALITTPTGKADWQNVLAERRLDEAATLAAQNNLGSSTQLYLEQQASLHIAQSEQDSSQIAASGNSDSAIAVRSDLEARLSAHSELLAALDNRLQANGDATTSGEVAMLLENVSQDQTRVSMSREAAEADTSTTTPSGQATIAFANSENSKRHQEEAELFAQHASILALVPEATTTASTSEMASTTAKQRNHPRRGNGNATSTPTTTGSDDTTASTTDSADLNVSL